MRYVIKKGENYFTEFEGKVPVFRAGRPMDATKFNAKEDASDCATTHVEFHGATVEETDT
jgi:hypothetical protein